MSKDGEKVVNSPLIITEVGAENALVEGSDDDASELARMERRTKQRHERLSPGANFENDVTPAPETAEYDQSDEEVEESENPNFSSDEDEIVQRRVDGLQPPWHVSRQMGNFLSSGSAAASREGQSLVWPPMLLVCIHGLMAEDAALRGVSELLLTKGLPAGCTSLTKFVCFEGNVFFDLFVLPPTGLAFAAAKSVDGLTNRAYTCYYPSLQDMVEIRDHGRVPEFSRRFVPYLRYHGMGRDDWRGVKVDLVRDDGVAVAVGVCARVEASECVDGDILGDSHVGVEVLEGVGGLIPFDWEGSLRRWKLSHALLNEVSLLERLRQHSCSRLSGSYREDSDLDVEWAVLQDQLLMSVAPGVGDCEFFGLGWHLTHPPAPNGAIATSKGKEAFDSLSAECYKSCQDAFHVMERTSAGISDSNDNEELLFKLGFCDNMSFEEKLQKDEQIRMRQVLLSLTNASTKRVLLEHLATSNGWGLTEGVVKRLKALHNQKKTHETPVNIMIEAAEAMELSTLCSIKEQVQLEKQQERVLNDMDITGKNAILALRESQHQSLMKLLAKNEASQTSKLEEFVSKKVKFVSETQKTKKQTESVIDWLSQHIARATDKVKRAHRMERKKWEEEMALKEEEKAKVEEQMAKMKEDGARSKAEVDAAIVRATFTMRKCELQVGARVAMAEEAEAKARASVAEAEAAAAAAKMELESVAAAKAVVELELCKQKRKRSAMPTCAICFEILEGCSSASGSKRRRRRACFVPCMHASMCSDCSEEAWEKYRRCPVCNLPCDSKPLPIFV